MGAHDVVRSDSPVVLLVSGVLGALAATALGVGYLNHDAAWYLHVASRWLDGATLYQDVIDTNPPLIIALTAAPVALARVFQIPEPLIFKVFVFIAGSGTIVAAYPVIRRVWEGQSARFLVAVVLAFSVLPFARAEFGQREHLAVLMVVPFVLTACAHAVGRDPGKARDVTSGLLAALGFGMKPHFIVAWLAIEAVLLLLRPAPRIRMRAGSIVLAGSLLTYAAAVALWVPQYLSVLRDVAQVYNALNVSPAALLRVDDVRFAVLAALALAILRLEPARRAPAAVLLAGSLGFLVAALVQMKGWAYHFLPFRVLLLLYVASLAGSILDGRPAVVEVLRGGRRTAHALVGALLALWSARYAFQAWRAADVGYVAPLARIVDSRQAESFALLAMRTHVYPAFPVVNYTRTRWVLRHNSLWFLPGLYANELNRAQATVPHRGPAEMSRLEREYYEHVVSDLCATPPRLLVVELPVTPTVNVPGSIDLVRYYSQDSRFERLFRAYERIAVVGAYDVYFQEGDASCAAAAGQHPPQP